MSHLCYALKTLKSKGHSLTYLGESSILSVLMTMATLMTMIVSATMLTMMTMLTMLTLMAMLTMLTMLTRKPVTLLWKKDGDHPEDVNQSISRLSDSE